MKIRRKEKVVVDEMKTYFHGGAVVLGNMKKSC